jgi:hypothetical protein
MTKIAIVPNAAGTGTFTIEAPNSNSNRTLVLPDVAGEILTDVSDIEAQVKAATNATGSAPIYACRAWVNFNGTGTVVIRASGNVSSVTRNSTGRYTINFTTAMPDAFYNYVTGSESASDATSTMFDTASGAALYTTTQFSVRTSNSVGAIDRSFISVSFFR